MRDILVNVLDVVLERSIEVMHGELDNFVTISVLDAMQSAFLFDVWYLVLVAECLMQHRPFPPNTVND